MKIANLNEEDQRKLSEFEEKLGVVLVAYSNDDNHPDEPTEIGQTKSQS